MQVSLLVGIILKNGEQVQCFVVFLVLVVKTNQTENVLNLFILGFKEKACGPKAAGCSRYSFNEILSLRPFVSSWYSFLSKVEGTLFEKLEDLKNFLEERSG
jgi:hypothetical protein